MTNTTNNLDYNPDVVNQINSTLKLTTASNMTFNTVTSEFERIAAIVVPTIFALIIVFGFLGNLMVLLVIAKNKSMKNNSTNLLIFNLAIADLSFIIICVPFTAVKYSNPVWQFGDIWCRIVQYMTYVCAWTSVYTLVLMCLDRLLAITYAIKLPNIRTKKNVIISVAILWILVLLANIPALLYYGERVYNIKGTSRRTCLFNADRKTYKIFHMCFFVFGFMLPVVMMVALYGALIKTLLCKKGPSGHANRGLNKTKRRVTLLVVAVVTMFVLCWLPIQIIFVLDTYTNIRKRYGLTWTSIQISANCLAYMNSCLNPILYTLASSVFRKAFRDLLCCTDGKKSDPKSLQHDLNVSHRHITTQEVGNAKYQNGATKPNGLSKGNDTAAIANTGSDIQPLLCQAPRVNEQTIT